MKTKTVSSEGPVHQKSKFDQWGTAWNKRWQRGWVLHIISEAGRRNLKGGGAGWRGRGGVYWVIWASKACAAHSGAACRIFSRRLFTWKHKDWICLSHVGRGSRAARGGELLLTLNHRGGAALCRNIPAMTPPKNWHVIVLNMLFKRCSGEFSFF